MGAGTSSLSTPCHSREGGNPSYGLQKIKGMDPHIHGDDTETGTRRFVIAAKVDAGTNSLSTLCHSREGGNPSSGLQKIKGMDPRLHGDDTDTEPKCFVVPAQVNARTNSPRHSREGGNPSSGLQRIKGMDPRLHGDDTDTEPRRFVIPAQVNARTNSPCHSREGGNPSYGLQKIKGMDPRLHGDDSDTEPKCFFIFANVNPELAR